MQSFDAAAIVQQLACGEIAVNDMAGSIEQQHRHRQRGDVRGQEEVDDLHQAAAAEADRKSVV